LVFTQAAVLEAGASFSACRSWRYSLRRGSLGGEKGRSLNIIALNPSTADETQDDPTIRRAIGFARRLGCDQLIVTNLFALRAARPLVLRSHPDPVGSENDDYLMAEARTASLLVVAWGVHGRLHDRDAQVIARLRSVGIAPWCWGKTRAGQPRHPLYLPSHAPLQRF
jgi:hypothetical protein